jgi:rhodanese-related sulfurtransferase
VQRRTFLAAAATVGASGIAGCASLLGGGGGTDGSSVTTKPGPTRDSDLPPDQEPTDGFPPAFDSRPPEQRLGDENFASNTVSAGNVPTLSSDASVTLASIEATYYWYARGEARFVDARGGVAYDSAHVYGAVLGPAGYPVAETPVADWSTEDRVVCYCRGPHHLSSIRAAELEQYGFEEVYVIDDGFGAWLEDYRYPVAGRNVAASLEPWTIAGETDPADAGETAWATHAESGQREATPIAADGTFEMDLYFYGVGAESAVTVETPSYTVDGDLGTLASGTVTAPA